MLQTASPLPLWTSTSPAVSLHTQWGAEQSKRFTSAIVPPTAGTSTANRRLPSPQELRAVTLIDCWAAAGRSQLEVGKGGCMLQIINRAEGGKAES
jgi:hypothetical protein